jgi:dGTPase
MNWPKLLNNDRLKASSRDTQTTGDVRNDFESDFGRIIFSSAIRRMHDKTQVQPLTTDDNVHSRLTHSMEVMAIGHSLGIRLCEKTEFQSIVGKTNTDLFREIPVILKNACLVHDIGNPPFGHFGERVIQKYFERFFSRPGEIQDKINLNELEKEDFTLFDGNAQGFRVLTKLQVLNDRFGLNLTYATLGSYLKYPNVDKIGSSLSNKKRGVFQSEREELKKVLDKCGLDAGNKVVRHPLCYLMEAADSICYLVMDIEDGFNKNWYSFDFIVNKLKVVNGIADEVSKIEKRRNGYGDEITTMVNFRIYLIQRLVSLAIKNFIDNYSDIEKGNYTHELIDDDKDGLSKVLRDFSFNQIFPKREITSLELTGHSVLSGLLDHYINFIFGNDKHYRKRAQGLISQSILRVAFIENQLTENADIEKLSDYYKLRVIVDFISGMTDQYAVDHYQKLSGQKII